MLILLAEDTQDSRDVIRAMLQHLGHEVFEAMNGKETVLAALRRVPEVGLIDLHMPEVSGLQAIAAVRAISTLRDFPIIAMSAYSRDMSPEQMMNAGCDAYLPKPFSLENLDVALSRFSKAA